MLKQINIGPEIGKEPNCGLKMLDNNGKPIWEALDVFPWVDDMKACMQEPAFHAEGDVWTHTKMVIEELQKLEEYQSASLLNQHILFLSALLHDVAKPLCTVIENGQIRSPRHAKVGEKLARQILWDMDFEIREKICALVRLHGLPVWALKKRNPNSEVIKASLRLSNHYLYALSKADMRGRISPEQDKHLTNIEFFKELCLENNCLDESLKFKNDHSRFKFFTGNSIYPTPLFDDTEFEITMMSGIAGSGKDTYIQKIDLPVVSLDDLRTELKVRRGDSKAEGRMIQLAYEKVREYARKKQSFIWNSTNLTRDIRKKLIKAALPYNPKIKIVYVETSWKNIFKRRKDTIKENQIRKMIRILELPQLDEAHEVEYIRN